MVKYVYYEPITMQVEAEFETPNLSVQENWDAKGLLRAIVPNGIIVTRDHRITVDREGWVHTATDFPNPLQPERPSE